MSASEFPIRPTTHVKNGWRWRHPARSTVLTPDGGTKCLAGGGGTSKVPGATYRAWRDARGGVAEDSARRRRRPRCICCVVFREDTSATTTRVCRAIVPIGFSFPGPPRRPYPLPSLWHTLPNRTHTVTSAGALRAYSSSLRPLVLRMQSESNHPFDYFSSLDSHTLLARGPRGRKPGTCTPTHDYLTHTLTLRPGLCTLRAYSLSPGPSGEGSSGPSMMGSLETSGTGSLVNSMHAAGPARSRNEYMAAFRPRQQGHCEQRIDRR